MSRPATSHQRGATAVRLPRLSDRSLRIAARVSQGVLMVEAAWVLFTLLGGDPRFPVGVDYHIYQHAASRWLGGGPFYMPRQLAGPYPVFGFPADSSNILYPPVALCLLVPFVFLPAALWWAIPIGAVALALGRLRPADWTWPIIAVLLLWPRAPEAVMNGNPAMWAWAAVALGVLWAWPAALALVKPTLIPFALVGTRHRSWWIVLGLGILVALPFGPMWLDYVKVVHNAQGGIAYLFHDYPLVATPLIAWLGRTTGPITVNRDLLAGSREVEAKAGDP